MGITENKELIRRFIVEVVNTGHVDLVADFVSPDCVETDGKVRVVSGIDGMADHIRGVRATYPDLQLTVERQIAEDDWVATQITARGTHQGEWLGIRPTGRQLVFTGVNVDRIRGAGLLSMVAPPICSSRSSRPERCARPPTEESGMREPPNNRMH
jgi:predicted ester cyclase